MNRFLKKKEIVIAEIGIKENGERSKIIFI
jgi:hypothetical protein